MSILLGCPAETRQVRQSQTVDAADEGPDSPETPKALKPALCLVYPEQFARLDGGPRRGAVAQAAFESAQQHVERGDHAAALKIFDEALTADPYHALSHLGAAESHLYTDNDVDVMRRHLSTAVVLLPSNPRAHLRLAELAVELKDRGVALTHLRCALELKPGYTEARYVLARQLAAAARIQEAEAELERVISANYEIVAARVLMAQILEAQGRLLEAAQQIEATARQVQSSATLYRQAGRLYEAADSPLSAGRMKRLADRLDPPTRARTMRPLKKRQRKKK